MIAWRKKKRKRAKAKCDNERENKSKIPPRLTLPDFYVFVFVVGFFFLRFPLNYHVKRARALLSIFFLEGACRASTHFSTSSNINCFLTLMKIIVSLYGCQRWFPQSIGTPKMDEWNTDTDVDIPFLYSVLASVSFLSLFCSVCCSFLHWANVWFLMFLLESISTWRPIHSLELSTLRYD